MLKIVLQGTRWLALRLSRRLNVLGLCLFAVLVALVPVGAGAQEPSAPPEPSSVSVWYAAGTSLVRVDAESGTAVGSVRLPSELTPVSGLASHPTDGSVAVLAKGHLIGFDGSGTRTYQMPMVAASSLGTAPVLASESHDGSLWVGGVGVLVLADAQGQNQRTVKLRSGEAVKAIAASQDGGAYVLTPSRLVRFSESGGVLSQRRMPSGGVSSPLRLAIDEFGGRAYLANGVEVSQVDLINATSPPLRKLKPKGGVGALSVNPFNGTLYVASLPSPETSKGILYSFNPSGGLLKKVSFSAKAVRGLTFDAPSSTLWLGTDTKVLGFREDLSRKVAIGARQPSALSVAPLSLSSRLSLLEPQNGDLTKNPKQSIKLNLKAYCNNEACPAAFGYGSKLGLEATLNGQDVGDLFAIQGDPGSHSGAELTYTPAQGLPEGENQLVAEVVDHFGVRSNRLETSFTVDTTAPSFLEVQPQDGSILNEGKATITGKVNDAKARVYLEGLTDLGGKVISDDPNGFSFELPLKEGENYFRLLAYDEADNLGAQTLKLLYEAPIELSITEPQQGSTLNAEKVDVKGTVKGPSGTSVRVGQVQASVDSQGTFLAEGVPLSVGPNSIVVEATAPSGNSVQKTLEVAYEPPGDPPNTETPVDGSTPTVRSERAPDSPLSTPGPLPPDPQDIAPSVDEGAPTDMADSTGFLYEGEDPVQTGVEEGTIQDRRVAVLKGKVLNRLGEPVPGVRITVLDHPEYGETLTREDGQFDLAVNGGDAVTLLYEKDRYMPAQRQVEAPWQDFVVLEDVVLVGFSRRVTDVDLAGTDEMLVARGSSITDADGTRQTTMLLPGDTEAEMVMPDGTMQPLAQIDFRATEYTVGEDGPEAMPAPLPSHTAYTYAVELSVDEAVEAGAEEVRFTEPLYSYIDNFLELPVGAVVPSGYYDKEKGEWVGSENGRVIKILSINGGLAELDVDGSGNPADAATLEGLGVTHEERAKLAGLYEEGKSLWRVPVDHFSSWDWNFPGGPPSGATDPNQPPPDDPAPLDDPDCQGGSVIECQNQILGEFLDVSGAPFSLHYGSERVRGREASRTLDIPLSGNTLPPGLRRIELRGHVAGQRFKKTFPAAPNQSYTLAWNGKDAYGRAITGQQDVHYEIGYVYGLIYQRAASSGGLGPAWSRPSGVPFTLNRDRGEVTYWQYGKGRVASWDSRGQGLGGWTPDVLHQYDPEGKTLFLGDGGRRGGEQINKIATTFAGSSDNEYCLGGSSGDGGPATKALLDVPEDVAAGPEGTIYIADSCNGKVRKVATDGTISTVAGGGTNLAGNGVPATQARLLRPTSVAVAPDGSLYIADISSHRVRQVGTDGTISTVAGGGTSTRNGVPATQASFPGVNDVAVGPDGSLYIVATDSNRVRRVGTDGLITTVAGTGAQAPPLTACRPLRRALPSLRASP